MINSVFDRIEFGILSAEDILQMSVAEINNTKLHGPQSVYDERLGPTIITTENCITCGASSKTCTGHFGHIVLAHPIFHPLYEKEILKLLKLFCFSCSRLIQADETNVCTSRNHVFKKMDRVIDKCSICPFCNLKQPIWEIDDGSPTTGTSVNSDSISSVFMQFEQQRVECTTYDVLAMFERYTADDLEKLNILVNPVNLIIRILPVLPPSTRPVVMLDDKYCDDDLTIQYVEIIKVNNTIANKKQTLPANAPEVDKYIKVLYFRISSLFNNSSGKSKHNTNGKAIKGIKERLATKNGLMRENLMGKRVEQSARTVIGPEPTLPMNTLAIPEEFARTLTIAERVTIHNIDALTRLVHSNRAKFIRRTLPTGETHEINLQYALKKRGTRLMHGDIIIRHGQEIKYHPHLILQKHDYIIREGELFHVTLDVQKDLKLEIGDIVDRCLRDGDLVILNRQPTLHAGSMIAQRVRIMPGKTLRFNLCITKSLNADFDGDEGNIHVPQMPNAIVELEQLSSVENHILSQQSGNANTVLVQDNLLSLYLISYENTPIAREQFFDLCLTFVDAAGEPWAFSELTAQLERLEIPVQNAYIPSVHLLSLCLPATFCFHFEDVQIVDGKWLAGYFTKKIMTRLIRVVYHVFGVPATMQLINNLTFVSNQWLYARGFSIGLEDCLTRSEGSLIPETIMRCFTEANSLKAQIYHEGIKEVRVQGSLNKARDVGMRIAKEGLHPKNNFLSTVHSGSKGDFFNIAQIAGLLGQQNFRGRRVGQLLNHGRRSLYHYDWDLKEDKDIYESRGFIRHSFLRGLNPREQYFHAISGREGITDTALGTGETGYMQRRIIKLMEDIHVANDGTIRDDCNQIYQFYYGQFGLDTTATPDLRGMVDALNSEIRQKKSL